MIYCKHPHMKNIITKIVLLALIMALIPPVTEAQTYTLRVSITDDAGNPASDAVIHHNGFSPQMISGGIYYFTTTTSGALIIERGGFVTDTGMINTQIKNVAPGTSGNPTIINFLENIPCNAGNSVSAGASIACGRLLPTLTVRAKNQSGEILTDATVRVFRDMGRKDVADDNLSPGPSDAQKTVETTGKANFALVSGRYYVRVERLGHNDANTVIDVPGDMAKTETVTLTTAGVNIVSPGRSQVTVSPTTVPADNISQIILTVKILDNTAATLTRRNVIVLSNRGEDTITPSSGQTNTDGLITFIVTSKKPGGSTFTILADSIAISTFPGATFTISAAALTSKVPSAMESKVEASISPIASNGEAVITVMVKNEGGIATPGATVTLASSRGEDDTISPASALTDSQGKASLTIRSQKAGTSVVTVRADEITLNDLAIITFSPSGKYGRGTLLKSPDNPAVYYHGTDGKRHAFPNERVYKSWYTDFSTVRTIDASELAGIALGKNVTYRPGVKMIKLQTVPKVYAVSKGGILRWVQTEEVAHALYGADWNKKIDDVSDALFTDYKEETNISSASEYSPSNETVNSPTIDDTL